MIYFDMDGVLTNFKKRLVEYKEQGLKTDYDFWMSLEELPIYEVILYLLNNGYKIGIISSLPNKESHAKDAYEGKMDWLNAHYPNVFDPIHITSELKSKFCKSRKDILIDNKIDNIDDWVDAGGVGIYFNGYEEDYEDLFKKLALVL